MSSPKLFGDPGKAWTTVYPFMCILIFIEVTIRIVCTIEVIAVRL